ncbi:MAG: extracellular matrix regulator RemB [Bacillota bacterium]
MFVHIGGSKVVFGKEMIGIFNLDIENSKINQEFLNTISNHPTSILSGSEKHKSFIVTDKKVYISPISPLTLSKRRNIDK